MNIRNSSKVNKGILELELLSSLILLKVVWKVLTYSSNSRIKTINWQPCNNRWLMTSNINPFNTINKDSLLIGISSHYRKIVDICQWTIALWMQASCRVLRSYQDSSSRNSNNLKLHFQLTLNSRGPLDNSDSNL